MFEGFSRFFGNRPNYLSEPTPHTQDKGYLSSPLEMEVGDRELVVELDSEVLYEGEMGKVVRGVAKFKGSEKEPIPIVVKFLRTLNKERKDRFQREIEITRALSPNPYLIRYFGICKDKKRGEGLVIELVEGGSLEQLIEEQKDSALTLDAPAVAKLGTEIALGLMSLHRAGVVHRDVKPGNILLEPEIVDTDDSSTFPYRAKLTDFGISGYFSEHFDLSQVTPDHSTAEPMDKKSSSLTQDRALLGTAHFMSPEQAMGDVKNVREASDLYAIGCVLYELASGKPVFEHKYLDRLLQAHISGKPSPVNFSKGVDRDFNFDMGCLIMTLLEKHPGLRRHVMPGSRKADEAGIFRLPIGTCLDLAKTFRELLRLHGYEDMLKKPPFSFVDLQSKEKPGE